VRRGLVAGDADTADHEVDHLPQGALGAAVEVGVEAHRLFSCGDGHGAQGDGEVNVTAIETALSGTFELVLRVAGDADTADHEVDHLPQGALGAAVEVGVEAHRDHSCGDGHGAQGDGEVNVTAIETALSGTFELVLRRDLPLAGPS
jgi:hypothetical protein